MNTESAIREVLSKMCALHGKPCNVEIGEDMKLTVVACCKEFKEQMENIIKHFQRGTDAVLSSVV